MHPATQEILKHFSWTHLPNPDLQNTSKVFADLARMLATKYDGPELTVGLRKLLESKDCIVRAHVEMLREDGPDAPTHA